jgi:uncharacterized protein YhdP
MIRRSSLIALEVVLGLAAAVLIAVVIAWWRLSQGPVELNFIREHVQAELSEARSGRPVGIERVELAWSRGGGSLELRAVGVTVEDGRGQVLSRSDEARIELGALPLLIGRISLVRADFSGGDISITRKIDGAVHIAFGPPGAPPDIIVPPPPINESLEQRVNRVLDGMQAAFRPVGVGGRLRNVSLRDAQLVISDEVTGSRWTADAATLALARTGNALAFVAEARLEAPQGSAPATLRITTDTAFQSAIVEFGARDVRPRALLTPAALGPFAGLDAPLTANISIGLDREVGINRLEGEVSLGRGVADMAGGQFSLDGGRLHGRYDLATDELIIDQLTLAGDRTRVQGQMHVRDASALLRANSDAPSAFDITLPALTLDVPGVFAAPIDLADLRVTGTLGDGIDLTRLQVRAGEATLEATGRVYWARAGAERRNHMGVTLNGEVSGALSTEQVLHLWPIKLGEGARHYLGESIRGGRVSDGRVRIDIRPSDLAAGALRNESLNVSFNLADAEMRFIETMSPLTHARAHGVLQGNRFDLTLSDGRLNNLVVTQGRVEAPRLHPKGALLTIAAHVEGDTRNVLEVLTQAPLSLDPQLPVDVATATGHSAVDLTLQRPLRNDVPFEQWRFAVDGRLDNFAGAMDTRRVALSQGQLRVRGDQRAITVSGPVRAGTSDVTVAWTETIARRGVEGGSRYEISGSFDAGDLVRLGYSIAQYAQGRVGVTVSGQGRGFDVNHANIELDLRNAAIESPWTFWTKRAGQTASARFDVERQADGSVAFNNLDARGGGLLAQGRVRVSRGEELLEVDLARLSVEGRSDARFHAVRAQDGGLDVDIRGALFDAAPFMDAQEPEGGGRTAAAVQADPPLRASIVVDRLKMRGGATLAEARVEVAVQRGALTMLTADGRSPGGRAFSLGLGPRASDPQGRIRLRAEDGGFAMRALTGGENVVGGTATAEGDWRAGPPSRANFNVHLRDFRVVRLPAMAGLLSSVGSLTGMVDTLNGDGIGFNALDASIAFNNNRMTFTDARAAGPALGLTASGSYDMRADNLDIDGVVVPSYGLNSMLGALPVLGDLFVSRQGEGVFGMTYSLNGAVAAPRVGVNPISMVTPGILRRIFEPVAPRTPAPRAPARPATPPPVTTAPDQGAAAAPPRETAALPIGEGDAVEP